MIKIGTVFMGEFYKIGFVQDYAPTKPCMADPEGRMIGQPVHVNACGGGIHVEHPVCNICDQYAGLRGYVWIRCVVFIRGFRFWMRVPKFLLHLVLHSVYHSY